MKLISTVFVIVNFALVSVDALLAGGLKIEANHGEDVTLSFPMDKAEEADRLRITFTSETTKKTRVIAQRCADSERCDVMETPGVKLLAGQGLVSVTIQKVNSSRSGLYKARAFFGRDVFERNVTLVVNELQSSSSPAPPHTSTPKPPSSSVLQWLYVVIPVVVIIIISSVIMCFCSRKRIRESEPAADVEEAREALCLQMCFQKRARKPLQRFLYQFA